MRSSGWTTLTTCNIRDTMEGASSYSRGSGLARCRGFGTRGWEVVGRTWTRRPPIPYRVVVRREGSGSPTRRAPRSAFGAKGRLGYRQGHDVSLYPTTKGSTRGLDTDTTSPGILLPATLDSSCSTYLTAPGWPSCVRIAGCRARAHTRVDRLGGLGTVMCPPLRVHGLTARRQSVCPAVGLGRSTARRAAGLGHPSLRCSWRRPGARLGWDLRPDPRYARRARRNPIPAVAPRPARRGLPPSSTSRPALGGHGTCHPSRERRTTGPRPRTAQEPPPPPKVEYRRTVPPCPTNLDSEHPFT